MDILIVAIASGGLYTRFFVPEEDRTFDEYGRRILIALMGIVLFRIIFGEM